ncbi:DUF3710 domain-containing protein [Pseudonocardia saturnea]
MTADAPGRLGRRSGATGTFGTAAIRRRLAANRDFGPFDAEDLDPSLPGPPGLLDFGSVRVPVPPEGTVTVEPTANGRLQAVHVTLPGGRLSVSALAAPKSSGLWAELVAEIDSSLRDGGARVRSFQGDWGRELHARTGAATSVFVGVDGARWMLYGVATGPERHAVDLEAALRQMLKGTVVDRGRSPFPVRTVLPLTVPDELAGSDVVDDSAAGVPGPPAHPDATVPPAAGPPAGRAPVPVRAPAPVVPRRIDSPTVVRPSVVPPAPPRSAPPRSAPPLVPSTPVRPAAAFPPPVARPPAGHPPAARPPVARPPDRAPADPTQALPVSRPLPERPLAGAPRAEPPAPLWATPAEELRIPDPGPSDFGTLDLGPDPADDVGTELFPAADTPATQWWPAPASPADPEPLPDPWASPGGWVADTPLHDELVTPPTGRRAVVDPLDGDPGGPDPARRPVEPAPLDPWAVGFVDGGSGGRRSPAAETTPAEPVGAQAWPVTGAQRVARHAAPADAAPRTGRRHRAGEPGTATPESTLDLAALVRDRPGRRHSRPETDEPGASRWDEAYRSPFGGGPSADAGPGLWGDDPRDADDDRWGAANHGLPGRGDEPVATGPDPSVGRRSVEGRRHWDRAADPSATHRVADDRYVGDQGVDLWSAASAGAAPTGGRRRRPDPADAPDPRSPDGVPSVGADAPRPGRRRAPESGPTTDPLPSNRSTPDPSLPDPSLPDPSLPDPSTRRRRSVDVPPDPDWVHPALRAGRVRDGSAPALAFLPEPASEPDPPAGRHHRPR